SRARMRASRNPAASHRWKSLASQGLPPAPAERRGPARPPAKDVFSRLCLAYQASSRIDPNRSRAMNQTSSVMPLILLAEDNQADVHLVEASLEEHAIAHELRVMKDGEQTTRFIDRLDADSTMRLPSLILLDLNLPKQDGREVLKHLRISSRCAVVPVIIVTSSDSPADRAAAPELGARAYFRKPSHLDEFMQLGALVKDLMETGA